MSNKPTLPCALAFASALGLGAASHHACADPVFADTFLSTPFGAAVQAMPENSWGKLNTTQFQSVWVPEALQAQGGFGQPKSVIEAWSSMAWDSKRGELIFWGGGHANYNGNEVYTWRAATQQWERASLPSQAVLRDPTRARFETVDRPLNSPISSHTYDNSEYLPIADRFITFGGAAAHSGSAFVAENSGGTLRRTGPYLWDPSKANGNLVGGLTGSGVDPATAGGMMWQNRDNVELGLGAVGFSRNPVANFVNAASAYAQIGGKDVMLVDFNTGYLLEYTLNDLSNPTLDTYKLAGSLNPAMVFSGTGSSAYDPTRDVYVRTAPRTSVGDRRLVFWDLTSAGPTNLARVATLNDPSGSLQNVAWEDLGIEYDPTRDRFVVWDGNGNLWAIDVPANLSDTWQVELIDPSGIAGEPSVAGISAGGFTGVLGKWKYLSGLDLFAGVIDSFAGDVWIYKPSKWSIAAATPDPPGPTPDPAAVPEPGTLGLLAWGAFVLAALRRGRVRTYQGLRQFC